MTSLEAVNFVRLMSDVFFLVRISDPETNEVFDLTEDNEFVPVSTCYQVWGRKTPCVHCSTLRTCRQRIMDTTCENVRAFLDGKPINVVNL